jgi:hypothetical protein
VDFLELNEYTLRFRTTAKGLLALACLAAYLAVLCFASERFDSSDLDRTFFPMMFCLTFPVGIVAAFVGLVISFPFHYFVPLALGRAYFYLLMWVIMVVAGYWQWFVALLRVFRRRHD